MVIILFIILAILVYVIFWQLSLIYSMILGAPTVYADTSAIIDCYKLAKLKKAELVVDLGCGDGKSLLIACKEFGAKGVGAEKSPYAYLLARIRRLIYLLAESNGCAVVFGDFRKTEKDLKNADLVYLYLFEDVLEKIESWLFNTIPKDCRVVSLAFPFKKHRPIKTSMTNNLGIKTTIYLYSKNLYS
jgi:SAM-dependent methyltransferase